MIGFVTWPPLILSNVSAKDSQVIKPMIFMRTISNQLDYCIIEFFKE